MRFADTSFLGYTLVSRRIRSSLALSVHRVTCDGETKATEGVETSQKTLTKRIQTEYDSKSDIP